MNRTLSAVLTSTLSMVLCSQAFGQTEAAGLGKYLCLKTVLTDDSAAKGVLSIKALPSFSGVGVPESFFPVVISNCTTELAKLPSCDRHLYVVEEALDAEGKWRPIETLPSSGCGNSYFAVALKPGYSARLLGRRTAGSFKTKLRFKLYTPEPIYSEPFDGPIDPALFDVPKPKAEREKEPFLKDYLGYWQIALPDVPDGR